MNGGGVNLSLIHILDEVIRKFNRMRMEMDAYKNFVDRAEDAKKMLDENVREYMEDVQEKPVYNKVIKQEKHV